VLQFRTQSIDEPSLLQMLPDRLRTEIAINVHLETLKKVGVVSYDTIGSLNMLTPYCITIGKYNNIVTVILFTVACRNVA